MIRNFIITGIGGQGVVTAAGWLRHAAIRAGLRLAGQDNRGGAQRLGHVAAIIRCTDEPERPLAPEIPAGTCDLLVSLEASEGLRFAAALGPHTVVVHSRRVVVPTNQRRARAPYLNLAECHAHYRQRAGVVREFDADAMAGQRFRQPVLANLILLGAGLTLLGDRTLLRHVETQLPETGRRALAFGIQCISEHTA